MYSNILYSFYFQFQGSSYVSLKAYFLFLSQSYKFSISFLLYPLSVKLLHLPPHGLQATSVGTVHTFIMLTG